MATFRSTLLLYLSLALAVAATSSPNAFGSHRRDHSDLARLVKKRTPVDPLGISAFPQDGQTPSASPSVRPNQDTSAEAQTTPVSPQRPSPTAVSTSASVSTTGGSDLFSSLLGGLVPTESSTTSSTLHTTSSSASSYSSGTPQTSVYASNTPAATPSRSTLFVTGSSVPTPTQTSSTSSSSGVSHAAMTVLIAIAASVGAAVIAWTIIRKWKFRPSSDFEGRMQPIDWQPGVNDDVGHSGQHRPLSRASSFHSGSGNGHIDDQMRGPVGGYGTTTLNPIPNHDFTAGPAHLAPVGGYADLARGPSPQPMMQESLGGAPIINRPMMYDQHGVPLHHGYSGY